MKTYHIKPEFLPQWGEDATEETVVTEEMIECCTRGWETTREDVLNTLEPDRYFLDLDGERFELKRVVDHETICAGTLADAGITEGEDLEWTNKLDDYFEREYGIDPAEWAVG